MANTARNVKKTGRHFFANRNQGRQTLQPAGNSRKLENVLYPQLVQYLQKSQKEANHIEGRQIFFSVKLFLCVGGIKAI